MLDIKQFNKVAFNFDATYNPVATVISAVVLFIINSYGIKLLNMTGDFVYVLSPLSIIVVLLAAVFFVLGVVALNNKSVLMIYAIVCAGVSAQMLRKYSLVGEYDLKWWGSFLVLSFVWVMLLNLLWRQRLIKQSSQCVLGTIAFILLVPPLMEIVAQLFSTAF